MDWGTVVISADLPRSNLDVLGNQLPMAVCCSLESARALALESATRGAVAAVETAVVGLPPQPPQAAQLHTVDPGQIGAVLLLFLASLIFLHQNNLVMQKRNDDRADLFHTEENVSLVIIVSSFLQYRVFEVNEVPNAKRSFIL